MALTPDVPPWPVAVKRWAVATIAERLPETSGALLAGLLLGERTSMPPASDEAFRRAGVYHILAVSGFNVALLAGAVFVGLALGGVPRRAAAMVAAAVLVVRRFPVYELGTGAARGLGSGVLGGLCVTLLVALAGGAVGPGRMADLGADLCAAVAGLLGSRGQRLTALAGRRSLRELVPPYGFLRFWHSRFRVLLRG